MRGLMRTMVVMALLLSGAWIAVQHYLSSGAAANKIAERLQALLGVPVTVGSLDLGTSESSAIDIRVFEFDSPKGSQPFLTLGRVTADIGISDLISATAEPRQVQAADVYLTLRYDRDGHLMTRLPNATSTGKPVPELRFTRGTLTICKEGESDCTIHNVDAVIVVKDGRVSMTGGVTDPAWGTPWTINGSLPLSASSGTLVLKNAGLHLKQDMLKRVPFVSQKVWKHVTLEGDTPVELQLTLPPPPAKVGFRVTLAPKNTTVYVPSIDLNATAAQGIVVVEDEVVHLREVRGKVAEGDLHLTSADLDFRNPTTVMKFVLDGRRLDIRKLPAQWKLPPGLGGKLSGSVDLVVRVIDNVAIPSGKGDGQVDRAMLGPIPIPNYGLSIQADRNGFSFEPRIGR